MKGSEPACGISIGQGLDEQETPRILGVLNRTQTGTGTYTRALYQKNEGSVKI
jgi:hypothetical protein